MITKNIGFIGAGNMGSAMIGGILSSGLSDSAHLMASAHSEKSISRLANDFQIKATSDNHAVAAFSDILFLAVKPYLFAEVIAEIKNDIKPNAVIVSVAAGQTIAAIEAAFGKDIRLMRAMPNTPALVGEAMSALCPNSYMEDEDIKEIQLLFESFGQCELITEKLMDAVIGVSGSSPAYIYMMIEAMADAAVEDGMPRTQAYKFAAQSVLGSAKMVLETGKHPGELKDAVCSPGGTTIEAVAELEKSGFRGTVIRAQHACSLKSKEMSNPK